MRFVSIASGSSGNCTYIGTEQSHILIDAGISCKRITDHLKTLDLKPSDLNGIFITHEHSDHIQGIRVLSKKFGIPLYGTKETLQVIAKNDQKGEIDQALYHPIVPDEIITAGDMELLPFSNSHDAANPVAYRVQSKHCAVGVVTDLGEYSDYTVEHMKGLNAVLIEANHDVKMLETGSYPYYLKRRIVGKYGHLSNECAGQLLNEILHDQMQYIMLGHLSQQNNYEGLAYEAVCCEIDMADTNYHSSDFSIQVAQRNKMSSILSL
ncbi:MAG: MBL fold metallo-hydrolase [Candidatus Fimimorpha sp.]